MYYLYSWVYGLSSPHCRIKAAACWGLTCQLRCFASLRYIHPTYSSQQPKEVGCYCLHLTPEGKEDVEQEGYPAAPSYQGAKSELRYRIRTKDIRYSISGRERSMRKQFGKRRRVGWFWSSHDPVAWESMWNSFWENHRVRRDCKMGWFSLLLWRFYKFI